MLSTYFTIQTIYTLLMKNVSFDSLRSLFVVNGVLFRFMEIGRDVFVVFAVVTVLKK